MDIGNVLIMEPIICGRSYSDQNIIDLSMVVMVKVNLGG